MKLPIPRFSLLSLTTSVAACLAALPLQATTYDPGADFSVTANPNGVWKYGYGSTLGGTMSLLPNLVYYSGCPGWHQAGAAFYNVPVLAYNLTGSVSSYGAQYSEPNWLWVNPGSSGYATLRFTAPAAGQYNLSGSFYGVDNTSGQTQTAGHILLNSSSTHLFDGNVSGFGPGSGPSFNMNENLSTGDYLDFAVTYRGTGCADTGIALVITAVPEPSAAGLLLLASAGLLIRRRRQPKSA